MIEFLLGAAFYLTVFSVTPGIGTNMQTTAILVMAAAAAYALLTNRVNAVRPSATEIVMYLAGASFVILAVFGDADSVFLSIAFLAAIISISIVSRSISLEVILDICARVALLDIATVIVFDHQQALIALNSGMGGGGGIVRFMPLHFHPDLTGYVFGSSVILMARRALIASRRIERTLMLLGAFIGCVFVLAASARSSIIAMFFASAVAIVLEYGARRFFSNRWVRFGGVSVAVFCALFASRVGPYFANMLELASDSRGVGWNGNGRTDLWARGIFTLFNDPSLFIFGGGFRSSNFEAIGFQTESSYISILLDSGAFLGTAIILVFWYAPIKALRLVPPAGRRSNSLILLASFMTFLIVESTFNRYLLALGNPASLMSLVVLFGLSMQENAASSTVDAPKLFREPQHTFK